MDIESLSAITLNTGDMGRSVAFYAALGFPCAYGGRTADFTSFRAGAQFVNLIASADPVPVSHWGRAIFHVGNVDAFYRKAVGLGLAPAFAPRDAAWGERYFHLVDPEGHELSFAKPLA